MMPVIVMVVIVYHLAVIAMVCGRMAIIAYLL